MSERNEKANAEVPLCFCVPADKGVPFCTVPEATESRVKVGDPILPGEEILGGIHNGQPQLPIMTEAKYLSPFAVWSSSYSLKFRERLM